MTLMPNSPSSAATCAVMPRTAYLDTCRGQQKLNDLSHPLPLEGSATQHAAGINQQTVHPLLHSSVYQTHCVGNGCQAACQACHRGHSDDAALQGALIPLHGSASTNAWNRSPSHWAVGGDREGVCWVLAFWRASKAHTYLAACFMASRVPVALRLITFSYSSSCRQTQGLNNKIAYCLKMSLTEHGREAQTQTMTV